MKKRITFLHTADVHIETFNQLLEHHDVELAHMVRSDWLELARRQGVSTQLQREVGTVLNDAAATSDAVVCTCSTLGPIAQQLPDKTIFRVDQPMMATAAAHGPVVVALCLESTLESSIALLVQAFARINLPAAYRVIDCHAAWHLFEANQIAEFGETLATIIKRELNPNSEDGCIVLAQASMTAAEGHLKDLAIPVYSSPALAANRALEIAGIG